MSTPRIPYRLLAFVFTATVVAASAVHAQTYEEQAATILQLFEAGQKDTAYALIEPLKREARFVPAVIYTRAQMTPDDRALNLYREVIALDPDGDFADESAYQLVVRYTDKRDSEAAAKWNTVLKTNYSGSPYVALADQLLAGITSWDFQAPAESLVATAESAVAGKAADAKSKSAADKDKLDDKGKSDGKGKGEANGKGDDKAKSGGKGKGSDKVKSDRPDPSEKSDRSDNPDKDGGKGKDASGKGDSPDTFRSSGMRGYALQVGLFPTRAAAETRAAELSRKKLKAVPLPKTVDGRKQYALVVGPYATIGAASAKKASIAASCDCKAFVVKVE